ncbi:hypothetical protein ACFSCW_05965 [Sphingomonas tabacisoli]|uniref:Uncharacterized protein n=1 Tax=Sphingomonas tabacisoli TaxID=2249466 RepID=A0ABW4I2M3_9SPHN
MGIISKAFAAATATAMLAGSANAACWTPAAYQAAQVRELDTMLMVEALRCRKTSASFLGEYNRFVQVSRPALIQANAELKAHFGGLNAYDNYMTTVANRYGAGTDGMDCQDVAQVVRAGLAAKGSMDALFQVAERANVEPSVDGGRCRAVSKPSAAAIASRR